MPVNRLISALFVFAAGLLLSCAPALADFRPPESSPAGDAPSSIATTDLNGDGAIDMVVANRGSDTVSVSLGNGDGTFAAPSGLTTGDAPSSVAAAKISGDTVPDLAVSNSGSDSISVFIGNGDGTFAAPVTVDVSPASGTSGVVAADMNEDSRPDLVSSNETTNSVAINLQGVAGDFGPAQTFTSGTAPKSLISLDFDHDGWIDIVTADSGSDTISVLLGNGDGTLAPRLARQVGDDPRSVASGQISNNTFGPDLAVANYGSNSVSVLPRNQDGSFGATYSFNTGSHPTSVAVGSANGTQDAGDILVSNEGSDNVTLILSGYERYLFMGLRPTTFTYEAGDGPGSIALGDINGDQVPDLVTANTFGDDSTSMPGVGPEFNVVPTRFDFPDQTVGNQSSPLTVEVVGTSDNYMARALSRSIVGPDKSNFDIYGDFCQVISPDFVCQFSARFLPYAFREYSAGFQVGFEGPGSPVTIPLRGYGVPYVPPPPSPCPLIGEPVLINFHVGPPFGTGDRVDGLRVGFSAGAREVSVEISPRIEYRSAGRLKTVHLRRLKFQVDYSRYMRFLLPPKIARDLREHGKRVRGTPVNFKVKITLNPPGRTDCSLTKRLSIRTRITGVSRESAF